MLFLDRFFQESFGYAPTRSLRDVLIWLHDFILSTHSMVSFMCANPRAIGSTNNDTGATTSTDTGSQSSSGDEVRATTSAEPTDESAAATTGAASAKPRVRVTRKVMAMRRSENTWSVREPIEEPYVSGATSIEAGSASVSGTIASVPVPTVAKSKVARVLVPTAAKSKDLPTLPPMPPCSSGAVLPWRGPDVEEGCKDCNKKGEDLGIPKHLWPVEEHDAHVDAILIRCSLEEFRHKFYAEAITYMDLRLLTDEDLIGLGLKLGQRRRLLDYVKHFTLKRKRDDMGGSD
jgi:hypothetical protein